MNETARTALKLFGGTSVMKAMLGAKDIFYSNEDNSFQFKFKGSKTANYFKMSYDEGKDLFNLEFGKISKKKDKDLGIMLPDYKVVKILEGVYIDQVIELFEKITGLYTRL